MSPQTASRIGPVLQPGIVLAEARPGTAYYRLWYDVHTRLRISLSDQRPSMADRPIVWWIIGGNRRTIAVGHTAFRDRDAAEAYLTRAVDAARYGTVDVQYRLSAEGGRGFVLLADDEIVAVSTHSYPTNFGCVRAAVSAIGFLKYSAIPVEVLPEMPLVDHSGYDDDRSAVRPIAGIRAPYRP